MSDRGALIYHSMYEAVLPFDDDIQLEYLKAVINYQLTGEISDLSTIPKSLFIAVKPTIDKAISRYNTATENGKKGGRPKKTQQNQKGFNDENQIGFCSKNQDININTNTNTNTNTNINTDINTSAPAETISTVLDSDEFAKFWSAYPRHAAKEAAYKAFEKHIAGKIDIETVIAAIEAQKQGEQWERDSGQYIPYPATWINQHRWEDEITAAPAAPATKPSGDRTAEVAEMMAELERQHLI